MGYPSEHDVSLTFEINYLRIVVIPTLGPVVRGIKLFARKPTFVPVAYLAMLRGISPSRIE